MTFDPCESIRLGVSRCQTVGMLREYYSRWRGCIEMQSNHKEIVGWFTARRDEIEGKTDVPAAIEESGPKQMRM